MHLMLKINPNKGFTLALARGLVKLFSPVFGFFLFPSFGPQECFSQSLKAFATLICCDAPFERCTHTAKPFIAEFNYGCEGSLSTV
jgi:hypothetical protein